MVRAFPSLAALVLALGLGSASDARAQTPAPADGAAEADAASCAERVALRVQRRYEALRNLSARFEQTTASVTLGGGEGADAAPSRGRVWLAKPGRMRWEYTEPEPSLVVSDGETLWIYDQVAGEAQRLAVGQGFLSGAALQFLMGEGQVLEAFEVSGGPCDADRVRLTLVPRRDATYERLEVVVDPETGLVQETAVADLFGNVTRVAFHDLEIDGELDASRFRFDAPEGVEVIELLPPS